jgi:hypothetical protein
MRHLKFTLQYDYLVLICDMMTKFACFEIFMWQLNVEVNITTNLSNYAGVQIKVLMVICEYKDAK